MFGWKNIYFEGFIFDVEKKKKDVTATGRQREAIEDGVIDEKEKNKVDKEVMLSSQKTKYDRKMAFGIVMKNIRLDEIALKLFNKTVLRRSWLSELRASK